MDVLSDLIEVIDKYLDKQAKTKEIELIQYLKDSLKEPFCQFNLRHSKDLFRAHFLLKHALYKLQNHYLKEREFLLDISLVSIERKPYVEGVSEMTVHDPVKQYYLDISHYFETEEDEINELLSQFWQKFLAQDDRTAALEALGLPAQADREQVKSQYRKLAQLHHPDKGGCEERFKKISAAKRLLDRALG